MKKIILAGALGIAALAGTNLPGLEATKASAASIESITSTIEGRVVEIAENAIYIESTQFDGPIRVEIDFKLNVKLGDQVKATGAMMRSFSEYMLATSVEKVQENKTLAPGMYVKENGRFDYVIGEITKVGTIEAYVEEPLDFVLVKYPKSSGKDGIVEVYLTQGQKFNVGDKVKVNNMENSIWGGSSIERSIENNIEKINDSKNSTTNNDQ
ncbi:ATP F0F1 synthase subunit alpha [Brevibacillus laterosporus]|nr:hypothetical protein [Brevibacillus laterosporus]TPG85933.1 ATP F0F1 synthase subunit alpha [Brevibacillus laterosporus]